MGTIFDAPTIDGIRLRINGDVGEGCNKCGWDSWQNDKEYAEDFPKLPKFLKDELGVVQKWQDEHRGDEEKVYTPQERFAIRCEYLKSYDADDKVDAWRRENLGRGWNDIHRCPIQESVV